MTRRCITLAVAVGSLAIAASGDAPDHGLGLVWKDGVLCKGDRPYRGVGVNYFDLFLRILRDPTNTTSLAGLKQLGEAGIPFARFAACGFWPAEWKLYQTNSADYFNRMDRVVKAAESSGVGLIPSLFWRHATLAEVSGEPVSAWGDPASRTHALMRRYTEEFVNRYRRSPAIWGWEFANEMSLDVDLPNARSLVAAQKAIPQLGVPKHTEADILAATNLVVALRAFGGTVRRLDPHRVIISGNSAPRPSAWHNTAEKSWTLDTREQFMEILRRDNPAPLPVLCVHWYPENGARFSKDRPATRAEVFKAMTEAAAQARKPLFIGEFGIENRGSPHEQKAGFEDLLRDLEQARIPLAALWVFDLAMQDKDWNVTFGNDRAWMLKLLGEANRRWSGEPAPVPTVKTAN